ncbi:hypothetical protein YA0010_18645 [Pseudomonas syringae]|uniref:Uncharacterized protein n=1 Tax=Pseudomonas phage Medea1 TaxID=2834256 RepID=A0A8E7KZ46_9CAUD|nr:hypothetical protein [Pseudomonas syringae]YP_010772988.1 hypothetical protein QIT78_gp58 [Pseudomonas phage Medea1]MBI6849076.1 hypothetical protein [Pseudomonas syringae]PYD05912.1 hypothetical protein DND90_21455 [Pseudomonas syringae pv. maculicola]QVW29125.1 hypothetical protein Medea1_0058 [Pseudomonas phage Medea1]
MSKHAAGPWNAEESEGEYLITNVLSCGNTRLVAIARHEGNAKLITAAPEMIAALERAALQFRYYEEAHREKGTDESMRKAEVNAGLAYDIEQIIAKATA